MNRLVAALAFVAVCTQGCTYEPVESRRSFDRSKQTRQASRNQNSEPIAKDRVLDVTGSSIILGPATTQQLSGRELFEQVGLFMSLGDQVMASDLLDRFPDVAREALFDEDLVCHPVALTVAVWLDQRALPWQGGWAVWVDDHKRNAARYVRYHQQRRSIWTAFRQGDFVSRQTLKKLITLEKQAFELESSMTAQTPWARIDAAVLNATARLVGGQLEDAGPVFEQAAELAQDWDVAFADRQRLFAALSYRLAGNLSQAEQIEGKVLSLGSFQLQQVDDPMILQLALKTLCRNSALMGQSIVEGFSQETDSDKLCLRTIHARIGDVQIRRGMPQAALLSFRSAESEWGTSPSTDQLRIKQAQALIALHQEQPAIVMLTGLIKGEKRPEALAMLGLIYLKRDNVDAGLAMLDEAVRLTTPENAPQIYADAGLALLSAGRRQEGLRLMRAARKVYQQRRNDYAVHQSLANELSYAQAMGDFQLVQEVRSHLNASQLNR